jgi:hypothetical protein
MTTQSRSVTGTAILNRAQPHDLERSGDFLGIIFRFTGKIDAPLHLQLLSRCSKNTARKINNYSQQHQQKSRNIELNQDTTIHAVTQKKRHTQQSPQLKKSIRAYKGQTALLKTKNPLIIADCGFYKL